MKIKPVKPSFREKKRYVLFKLILEDSSFEPEFKEISDAIHSATLKLIGIKGAMEAGVQVLREKYDNMKKTGLIRVNHKNVDNLILALSMITKIKNRSAIVTTKITSGSMKTALKKI